MAIKLQTQNDYLLTEVVIDIPPDRVEQNKLLGEIDALMRASHGTGKVVAQYSSGGLNGINVEQRSKIRGAVADRVRDLVGIETVEVNGYHK
jgi:hypothetical protein